MPLIVHGGSDEGEKVSPTQDRHPFLRLMLSGTVAKCGMRPSGS